MGGRTGGRTDGKDGLERRGQAEEGVDEDRSREKEIRKGDEAMLSPVSVNHVSCLQ